MKKLLAITIPITVMAFVSGVVLSDQVKEQWPWPDSMDALTAAPKFHKSLFENDHIRLLEVTVNPGVEEQVHTHRYPSAVVMDAPVPIREESNVVEKTTTSLPPRNENIAWLTPQCALFESTPPHKLKNEGTYPIHFYRIEFKRLEGNDIMKKTAYQ
jgi:hypothetical protein